jgi:PQQ-dependent dehydrogenase (methanol/ethanol family)
VGWIAYDPDLNLIYYGTGNPGPWNHEQRPGDNKWTAGIFARDPDNGAAKWFYQTFPHDEHDYDSANEIILLDMPVDGQTRKVLIRPDRNGYLYVIDRATGEVLSADAYGPVNSTKGIDLKTGRPILNPEKETKLGQTVRDICPTASGTKDWEPSAFSPRTGLIYVPHANLCMDWENIQVNYISGTPYVGANVRMKAGPWQSRRTDRLGPGQAQGRVGRKGRFAGVERCARHRRRPRLLRNHGRLVQGGRCQERRAQMAVQNRFRDYRTASRLSRP